MLCLCLALMSFVTMAVSIPHCVVKSDRMSLDDDQVREDHYYEALALSRHSINLEPGEEFMKPEKATMAPGNSGVDPSTMKMKQWYQGQDRLSDESQWQLPSNRMSGKKAPTGTDGAYQARGPIEGDKERLAMRRGVMPPPVPQRVANPRIREDRAVQDFRQNSEKMHRATHGDAYTRAWFDYCRSVFSQSVREAGPNVDLYNVSTYQCSILFNNMGSFNRKIECRKAENMYKPVSPNEKFNVTNDPQLSLLREFWGNNYAHEILTAEADSLSTDEKESLDDCGLVGCHSSRSNDLSVHAGIDSSGYIRL